MFVIRETFTAKPGQASKLAKMFHTMFAGEQRAKMRVLTDYIARFNTVVLETEIQNLDDFEKMMQEYTSKPEIREQMKGYTDLYDTGRREVYRVVE